MSKLYIIGKKSKNEYGNIGISSVVFEDIVFETMKEIKDVRIESSYNKRQISCYVENNIIHINIEINVKVGSNVNILSEFIQNSTISNIKGMTGFDNVSINIIVKGFFIS